MTAAIRIVLFIFAALVVFNALSMLFIAMKDGDNGMLAGAGAMALLAIGLVLAGRKLRQHKPTAINQLADQAADYFEHINTTRAFPPAPTDRVISKPDAPVLAACDARLLEMKSNSARAHAATRIKIGNQPFYIGGSRGAATISAQQTDFGELAVTPKTLIFVGDQRSVDIPLAKITAVDMAIDAVTISTQGRQRPLIFAVNNGLLWAVLIKNLMRLSLTGRELPPGAQIDMM